MDKASLYGSREEERGRKKGAPGKVSTRYRRQRMMQTHHRLASTSPTTSLRSNSWTFPNSESARVISAGRQPSVSVGLPPNRRSVSAKTLRLALDPHPETPPIARFRLPLSALSAHRETILKCKLSLHRLGIRFNTEMISAKEAGGECRGGKH